MRTARIARKTHETDILVEINLDGTGKYDVSTGIGFLDHIAQDLDEALALIAEDEDRLRAVEKEVYTPIADKKMYEPKAVQSTIRRASKVAWDLCPERVQELAGYPPNGRPSAVTMIELLYNGVARYDDLSILK